MRNCIVCGHLFAEQEHGAAQLRLQSLQNKMEKTERVLDSFCFFMPEDGSVNCSVLSFVLYYV